MLKAIYKVLFALALSLSGALAQDRSILVTEDFLPSIGRTKEYSVSSPLQFAGNSNLRWFTRIDHEVDTKFLRLHIRINKLMDNVDWSLHILDADYSEVEVLTAKNFKDQSHYLDAWSEKVRGRSAIIELLSTGNLDGFQVSIDRYNYQLSEPSEKAFIGQDDRQDLVLSFGKDSAFYKWGLPIASIMFVSAEQKKETGCTAFLVSKDLLITNQHCINQEWQVQTVKAIFGYETNSQKVEQYSAVKLIAQNSSLDYSILRLDRSAGAWSIVSLDNSSGVAKDQNLILIQSPPMEPKKIAVHKCKVQFPAAKGISDKLTDFYHLCDSEGGSSGSPVMDRSTGKVVGLHHAGQYDPSSKDYHNLGVNIQLILADIAAQSPEICREIVGCHIR